MTEFHASDTVGGYRLEARLGGGGFGTVWRARRASDNQLVALKLLPDTAGTDDVRLRADVELLAASAASSSPHVVRVLDGGVDPVPYVVMEFIHGINLAEELKQRQRLPQQEVIEIGLAIADALKAINAAGIVHRDIKPSNVMIDRAVVVKLTDFGIAKIAGFDAVTLTGQLPLSIAYAAPEVWEGRAEHRSDLYALAIVLYQCLTGQLPFRGAYAELFYQHRSKEPDLTALATDTAPALVELIRDCLAKDPSERPADAAALIELLQRAAGEVAARPVEVAPQAREPERFGPWLKQEGVQGQPWAWYCRHETTDEEAIVEIHFADSIAYGEALRRAVAANDRLVSLGAERLLGTNRLILRPNEVWQNPPEGAFQFWVARDAAQPPAPPHQVSPRIGLRVVESLIALIEAADEESLPLKLDARELTLLPDGAIYLRHPGFPGSGREEPERQALSFVRSLPLTREVRASLSRAKGLDEARRALAMLTSVREIESGTDSAQAPVEVDRPIARRERESDARTGRFAWIALVGGAAAILGVIVAIAVVALFRSGDKALQRVTATETAALSPANPVLAACLELKLPAPISAAEGACGNMASFTFDASCPRGQACNRKASGDSVSVGINDRSVAFIDSSGNVAVAREDGSEPVALTSSGRAQQPAWSPDGRYLAYLVVLPLPAQPAALPSPPATPAPSQAAPPGPLFATQLRVIEVDRPINDGVLLGTSASSGTASWLQRYAAWPQWSPDGKTLYFLSIPVSQPGGLLYGIEVPTRSNNEIDFSSLRSGLPPNETSAPARLLSLSLSGADFGQPQAFLGRYAVRPNGEIFVQVCDGDRTRMSCGLGRWTGRPSGLVPITRDRVVEPPVAGTDGSYAYVKEANGAAGLIKIGLDGVPLQAEIKPQLATEPADGAWFAVRPQLAVTRRGDALLAPIGGGTLGGIRLTDGASSPWRAGSSPVWFVAGPPGDPVPSPPTVPFTTPTPGPTPTVTVTPTLGSVQTMTLNLTASRGGALLPGATITALVGSEECARGTTDNLGRVLLVVPRTGAPPACSRPGAAIGFLVNGMQVQGVVSFDPLSRPSLNLNLP